MKCIYCGAEIEQDAQFCTNCGKNLSKFNRCVKCGELLDTKTQFCPYCGSNQYEEIQEKPSADTNKDQEDTLQPNEQTGRSKKWLWLTCVLLAVCLALGGLWFLSTKQGDVSEIVEAESSIGDETIFKRLTDIYNDVFGQNSSDDYDSKYCSKSFLALLEEFDDAYDNSTLVGSIVGPDVDHWTISQDALNPTMNIISIDKVSDKNANAKIHIDHGYESSGEDVELKLVFENGDWFIDDFNYLGSSERKEYQEAIKVCKENVSKVNAKNVGECYTIGNIKALTFEQMLFIASNRLSAEEIDYMGFLCDFKNVGKRDNFKEDNCSHAFASGGYSLDEKYGVVERESGKDAFMFFVRCEDKMYTIGVYSTTKEYFKMLHADMKKVCQTVTEGVIGDYDYGMLSGSANIQGLKSFDFNFDCQKDDVKFGFMELNF